MIQQFINYAAKNGIKLEADPYFTGIKTHRGDPYFCLHLGERTFQSQKFNQLLRLSEQFGKFIVEPSGMERVVIIVPEDYSI